MSHLINPHVFDNSIIVERIIDEALDKYFDDVTHAPAVKGHAAPESI